ncbi:phosphoglycerate mutase [Fictibacillus sp. BK138]|nr:phosphoglycerate mutase [Fictibacillus sp. BK138]
MLLRLFVTRHGETIWNTQQKLQGWKDSDLTKNGVKNALSLGSRLRDLEFQSIYASPSRRTLITAELIRGEREQEIIEDENLREINLGDWEGQTHDYVKGQYPDEYSAFWNTPHLYTTSSGEDFYQLQERVNRFLNKILSKHDKGDILIVTHSVFIKALLSQCKRLSIADLWNPPHIHDTSLTVVEVHGNQLEIKLEGDVEHLNEGVQNG